MINSQKEVYFHEYCKTCQFADVKETEEPCNECLTNPVNDYSHKPVKYIEDKRRVKQGGDHDDI